MQWFWKYLFVLIIFANFVCHIIYAFFSSLCFDNNRKKQRINSAYYLSEDEKKKKKEKKDKKQIRSVKQKTEHLNTIGGISLTRILYKPLMSDCWIFMLWLLIIRKSAGIMEPASIFTVSPSTKFWVAIDTHFPWRRISHFWERMLWKVSTNWNLCSW